MARLTVRSSAPTDHPDQMLASEVAVIPTRMGVQLLLEVEGSDTATCSVRPWFYLGGRWNAARADATPGVGVEPVTAHGLKFNGLASGIFMTGPMAVPFCLVAEAGNAADVIAADLDEYHIHH